jgi:hypothetical protein
MSCGAEKVRLFIIKKYVGFMKVLKSY